MKHTMKLLLAAVSLFAAVGSWAALESVTYIPDLNVSNPTSGDPVSQADDHIRNIKTALRNAHMVIDRAYAEYTTSATLSALIPFDDTIPQITEGTQILSASITPKSTASRIRIRFQGYGSVVAINDVMVAAIFVNGATDASAAGWGTSTPAAGSTVGTVVEYEYSPASTSAQAITVRVGASAGALRMNGTTSSRVLGGVARTTLIVEEIT